MFRSLVSILTPLLLADVCFHLRGRLVPPGVYADLTGEEKDIALRATRERYLGEEGERERVEMGLWIKAVNPGLFEDLHKMLLGEAWVESRGEWDVGESARGKVRHGEEAKDEPRNCVTEVATYEIVYFSNTENIPCDSLRSSQWFVKTEGVWGRLSREDEASLESSRIMRRVDVGSAPPPQPKLPPAMSTWHVPGPRDIFVDQGRHVVTPGLEMRPVYWRYYEPRLVRRSEWSMEGGSGLIPFCDGSGSALEDAYRWLRYKGGGSLTVQVREEGEDWMVQFRGVDGDRVVAVRRGVGGAVGLGKRRVFRGVSGRKGGVERTETFDSGQEGMEAEEGKGGDEKEDVQHLVLVVHGIGAQLQAFDLLGLVQLKSIIDCCSWMRNNHVEVSGEMGFTGRVEYIPIEWHERWERTSR